MPAPYPSSYEGPRHYRNIPADKCVVYPLTHTGAAAYILYASASGPNRWDEVYEKLEAESDAVRGAGAVFITVAVNGGHETVERDMLGKDDKHGALGGPYNRIARWGDALAPPGVHSMHLIGDERLGDTVVVQVVVLPQTIGEEWWKAT